MNRKLRLLAAVIAALCVVLASFTFAFASPTDEILLYEITADVNDDATVTLAYHIQWKVLQSDGIGPMSWITVGVPNSHTVDVSYTGGNVTSVELSGSMVNVYLNKEYYKGEIADIEFTLIQDYMYSMNQLEDGYTNFYFTPGWFDEIEIDEYEFRWNADKATSWSPDCLQKGGYLTWTGNLKPGRTVSLSVNYPNDAFMFNESKSYNNADDWGEWDYGYDYDYNYDNYNSFGGGGFAAFGITFWIIVIAILVVAKKAKDEYNSTATFGSGETKKKVTRTKVEYYPVCQGCGAPRAEGQETCTHCGRSFIKSEETVTEEEVKAQDKDALKHTTNGVYHYGSSPNTYMRVNVINVPVHHSAPPRGGGSRPSGGTRSGSSGSHRSGGGCVHSSCACACASCACACACACAGGGRAGCTYKDFYKTDLKLRQLKMKKAEKKEMQ